MSRTGRAWAGLRTFGRGLFVVVMVGCVVVLVVVGAISWLDRDRPVFWGTFTATSTTCDPGPRRHCTTRGDWVSDDAQITKANVVLDGAVDRDGSVRSSYQPGGLMGDDANNVVHTGRWTGGGLWVPWAVALVVAGQLAWCVRRWRRPASADSPARDRARGNADSGT